MLFRGTIIIPANTSQSEPVLVTMPIDKGIITKFMVRPRVGHAGLAHLQVLNHTLQIAPSLRDTDISGDAFPIDWEEYYEAYQPPFELVLVGWNEDDTYEHTFDVFVAVLPRKAVFSVAVGDAIKGLSKVIAGLTSQRIIRK